MGRDTVQLETAVRTITQEYLLEFTSEYGISKALHLELAGPKDRIVDFPKGKEKYPVMLHQALRLPKKLEQPFLLGGREGVPEYCGLKYDCSKRWDAGREYVFPRGCDNTEHTPYPNPETTRGTTLLIRVEPQILHGRRGVKTGSRPRAGHEVSLLIITANRVIEIEDPATATDLLGEAAERVALEAGPAEKVTSRDPPAVKECRKRGHDGVNINVPPKVLRRDHADPRPTKSTYGGKYLAAIELGMGSTRPTPTPQGTPVDVSDLDPLSFADPQSRPLADVTQSSKGAAAAGDPESENTSFASMFGSQLRLRFEQEAKLLKKSVAQVARQDKRIQARENEIKNLKTLLEVEADMRKSTENKSTELSTELENMRALVSDLQVSNNHLSQQVSSLQEHVTRKEKLKAAFEEFKQYEDNRVEQRCAEMDAYLDALSIDFDKELYPHMLTVIAGHRWMIGRGLRLAVMKYGESTELRQSFADVVSAGIAKGMSEGLKHGVEHGHAKLDLEAIEAYDPEAEAKYIVALHALKNLKDDAPQWVHELCLGSSQLTIPVYLEKKCRVVYRIHGVGSSHHARSDGVPVSKPTVAPQGLAILLADAATQTETSDEASSQMLRSSSLFIIHG
nr:hypothetical protein [Tanacetum cinerariifolium]